MSSDPHTTTNVAYVLRVNAGVVTGATGADVDIKWEQVDDTAGNITLQSVSVIPCE